ncbi:ABC transporter permease [Sulfidibacter corallicola]|uniref:ABC transporter permease n=1 Tax=Sulfidibacter corallicola TaxID=2818388 RepID=A0A8A4TFM0_SULCO|nr:ABC transporter permease [Sulfidibacter corallicola]QTD48327.1 ABC transporter permease [Sulfidibacter corallicola]
MLGFYVHMAVKSLRATPLISLVTVFAIGIGVTVSTTIISVENILTRDPFPAKSDKLFNVRMDSWDPDSQFFDVAPGEPPKQITYRDMVGIMESDIPRHQTGVGTGLSFVFPENDLVRPYRAAVQLVHAGFFPLTQAPFRYGQGWNQAADRNRDPVCVLSQEANEKLFGGEDSVGRQLRIGKRNFSVIGVLDHFNPTPKYYDTINDVFGDTCEILVPFDFIKEDDTGLSISGNTDNWGPRVPRDDTAKFLAATEMCWIQFWVELDSGKRRAYHDYLDAYAAGQRELGRFPRENNNRVTPLLNWLAQRNDSAEQTRAMAWISVMFLLICALNITGLLLGKFLSRSGLVGVHRALGASKRSIFAQHLLECWLLGIAGGLAGLVASGALLRFINAAVPSSIFHDQVFSVEPSMFWLALGLSLIASLVAGVYPAWRACQIAPAVQLKLQ